MMADRGKWSARVGGGAANRQTQRAHCGAGKAHEPLVPDGLSTANLAPAALGTSRPRPALGPHLDPEGRNPLAERDGLLDRHHVDLRRRPQRNLDAPLDHAFVGCPVGRAVAIDFAAVLAGLFGRLNRNPR